MPGLDVLRGVAVLWVLLNHALIWKGFAGGTGIGNDSLTRAVFRIAQAGWLGVNLFFVLSGFLITGILLDSRSVPQYFSQFYRRRALRILPAYLLLIAVLLSLRQLSRGALAVALTFTTNDAFLFGVRKPYGLLWSIAVEEQFYLLWPWILRDVRPRQLAIGCAVLLVADPLLRYGCATGVLPQADVQRNALLIADNLACGALAALFVRSRFGVARIGLPAGFLILCVAVLGELAGLRFGIAHRATPFGMALQHTPPNLFFTGLLLLSLSLPAGWFAAAWSKPMRFFGYVSYGLYLCHLLVFDFYDRWIAGRVAGLQNSFVRLLLAGGLATLVAFLSRRFFEEPFLRMGSEGAQRRLRQALSPR